MGFIKRLIRNSFLWTYARNTWQWDVLCVLILIFIFLTPKSWFANGERRQSARHQNDTVSTVRLGAEAVDYEKDRSQLEQRVRTLSGRPDAQIIEVRTRQDGSGKIIGYEVDIR